MISQIILWNQLINKSLLTAQYGTNNDKTVNNDVDPVISHIIVIKEFL